MKTKYEAVDGEVFTTASACITYEQRLFELWCDDVIAGNIPARLGPVLQHYMKVSDPFDQDMNDFHTVLKDYFINRFYCPETE